MSDTPLFDPEDDISDIADIEALLREIEADDLELTPPPADLWDGIATTIRDDEHTATVVSLAERRARFTPMLLTAAAAIVLLIAGAVVVTRGGSDDVVVATAELSYDPEAFDPLGADAEATARLVERGGGYEIRLDDASLPDPAENDLELWLISTDADGAITDVQPVSLVDAASPGTYAVPSTLDPDVYTVVDISVEPRDGDEAHSGRSILRGVLADV